MASLGILNLRKGGHAPVGPGAPTNAGTMLSPLLALTASVGSLSAPQPSGPAVRAEGSGELRLAHSYPLRELTYTADPSGRGLLVFGMGRGVLVLTGADADKVAADTYVLHLDVLQVDTMKPIKGDCRLSLADGGHIYRSLNCQGRVLSTGERFSLAWRGEDKPAVTVP